MAISESDPGHAQIALAGGCFWGLQAYLRRIPGVLETTVGYANGHTENPTYQQVCAGTTGHAETVLVSYDPEILPLIKLLEAYFEAIDPPLLNRQGNDRGSQYRTGIYYSEPADRETVLEALRREQEKHASPVVTEAMALSSFWPAEEYHQDYLEKNPGGYCHIDVAALLRRRNNNGL